MRSKSAESLIRPNALNRKNGLFVGHDKGRKTWGLIASLIETVKVNGVDRFAYLNAILDASLAGHPQNRIHDLLLWNFQP